MGAQSYNADLPSAVVGLISLILVISVLDAGVATRWVRRRADKRNRAPIKGRTFAFAYGVGFLMLGSGLAALAVALGELYWETNRCDEVLLVLTAIPVAGLAAHFGSRLKEEIRTLRPYRRPPEHQRDPHDRAQ